MIWKRTAVTGAILAAMAAPLIVMPTHANADLASAVESGSYGPVVTIVSPQYADVVKGTSVSIDVAVQQRTNPVKALRMFVDDHIATPGWVPLKSLQSSKFNWDTTLFNNGPHKLTVRVIDSAGMIGQAEITVYVNNASQSQQQDATAPALKWLGVQNGQMLKGVVDLQLQASGSFGVKYVFVMLNSATTPDQKPALRSWMINQPPYIISFDTTKVNDGDYVLDALAYDALSNQGEAPRLNISIANNTINPTYIGSDVPSVSTNSTPSGTDNATTLSTSGSPANNTNVTNTNTTSSGNTTSGNLKSNSGNSSNTNVALSQTTPLVVPFVPVVPTFGASPSFSSARNDNRADNGDNSNSDNNSGNSLVVETQSSAQLQYSSTQPQPRVTDLPVRLASNDISAQTSQPTPVSNNTDIAQSTPVFSAPVSHEPPLTTMAETKLTPLSNAVNSQAEKTNPLVLEAKLPSLPAFNSNAAMENSMRQLQPLSTLINTQSPNPMLAQPTSAQAAPQRYFQVNDAMSIPMNEVFVATAEIKHVDVPALPQPSLDVRTAKVTDSPLKSTFATPSMAMTDVNVGSRMTQAKPGDHVSPTLIASAQIGTVPGYVAPKSIPVFSGQPLFTVPDGSTIAGSRIASANLSGKSWGYQHNAQNELGQSTKPQVAFLPKFNSEPKTTSFASITVSPVSTKMQVSEMSQSWPAVYHAKQRERLSAIAQRYDLPVEVLAKNNGLETGAVLTVGQKIKMPRNLQVTYNGKALHSDVSSMLVGTTSVAAFRFLFEQQGGKTTWDPTTQTVHAKNSDNEVTLTIGSNQAVVNQKAVMMDMAAFLLSGRTMVPVRLFEKSLNAQVTWDPSTGRMFMAMAG
ncbi:MAG: stalk domain-containing protein [Abditibacteriaceae bacterium]